MWRVNSSVHLGMKNSLGPKGSLGSLTSSKMVSIGSFLGVFEKGDFFTFLDYRYKLEVEIVGVKLSRRFSTSI